MTKLTTLKSRLSTIGGRLSALPVARPGVVERKRGSAGVKDRNRIRARDHGLCQECKRQGKTSLGAAVDHIKPLWDGGDDSDTNKELLCQPCHDAKSAREAKERGR
ncbi:HNH endonuclease [Massilia sp. X63]|uniref:HNH endonuclease n=1 Tax=Massilia sp. X63 TaxID=3237285 RepID=UPI0034DD5920